MYYQNYDDYMRDVLYFNQMPNPNYIYPNMGYNAPNQNFQNFQLNNPNPNFNNMYPSIYRIVQPVVSRVVTGNNYQYMTEDNLNSMVDTVYNIVEGDVSNSSEPEQTSNNNNNLQTQRNNTTQNNVQTASNSQNNMSSKNNDNNQSSSNLLKDLIKILLIKELINRNNIRRFSNNGIYGYQNYPNYYDQRYMF